MSEQRPFILAYARQLRRDWIDRWPWIGTTAGVLVLLLVIASFALFAWFLLRGPPG